jgi:hypothetical protein
MLRHIRKRIQSESQLYTHKPSVCRHRHQDELDDAPVAVAGDSFDFPGCAPSKKCLSLPILLSFDFQRACRSCICPASANNHNIATFFVNKDSKGDINI